MSFFDPFPWQRQPSLPRAPAHGARTCQLVAKSGPVPCHWAHFTNKGAKRASWLHDMDTCPLSLGPDIGPFTKASSWQAGPARSLSPRLSWGQRLVCNTACLPPGVYFELQVPSYGGPCGAPRSVSPVRARQQARRESPRPAGSDSELVTRSLVRGPPLAPHQASEGFSSHEVSVVSHPLKQSQSKLLWSCMAPAQDTRPLSCLPNPGEQPVRRPGPRCSLVHMALRVTGSQPFLRKIKGQRNCL